MPNYYEISATDDKLRLKDGQGTAGFTVRYVGERSVEARVQAVAVEEAKDDWLQVEESRTRDMEPNQTHTFSVNVQVPPGTPAGRYGLRLDAMSVDNTDEEYDQGPVVSFEVLESKPAAKPAPTGFPWWAVIAAAVVLALVIGGIVWYANSGDGEADGNGNGDGDEGGLASVTAQDWVGFYEGRLDGRNATLQIELIDGGGGFRIVSRDLDRDAQKANEVQAPSGNNAHVLRGPFGDREEMLVLHRHDRGFISMQGKWKGISFGRAFSTTGFDAAAGGNFDKNRWERHWQGTFEGRDDGRPATLRVQTRADPNQNRAQFEIELTVEGPGSGEIVYSADHERAIDGEPRIHILEDVALSNGDGKSRRIRELLMHTWGANYITGIAETPDGTVVGQVFVRR